MKDLKFLQKKITTIDGVYDYIITLQEAGMLYHFDEDAEDICWLEPVSDENIKHLNARNYDMWNFLGVQYDTVFKISLALVELDNKCYTRAGNK